MPPPHDPERLPAAELLEPDELPVAPVVSVQCWRCDRVEVPRDGLCPACGARLQERSRLARRFRARKPSGGPNSLVTVLVLYCILLGTLALGSLFAKSGRLGPEQSNALACVMGIIDLILAIVGIALVGRLSLPAPSRERRLAAWAIAWPVLCLLIGGNLLYFGAIKHYVDPPKFISPSLPAVSLVSVLLICVEPAIVEELFCRYLALGVLYRAAGMGTAVVVSSVMFAVMHISNPIGVPYLFLAGVVLALARVYGGLLLPMILHFLHNLAVMALEVGR